MDRYARERQMVYWGLQNSKVDPEEVNRKRQEDQELNKRWKLMWEEYNKEKKEREESQKLPPGKLTKNANSKTNAQSFVINA